MEIQRILSRMTSGEDYDVLDLLRQDHTAVIELFDYYKGLDDQQEKEALVSRIIRALTVHARIEEELFYPALRQAIGDQTVLDQANVEPATIRKLMAALNRAKAGTSHFDAGIRSLADLFERHAEEQEGQMFQQARNSNLNLVAIGGQLDAYRAALESRYELDTDGKELEAFLSAPTVLGLRTSASASHEPRRPGREDVASISKGKDKPRRKIKSLSTSGRRRARRSSRPEVEASEGEST